MPPLGINIIERVSNSHSVVHLEISVRMASLHMLKSYIPRKHAMRPSLLFAAIQLCGDFALLEKPLKPPQLLLRAQTRMKFLKDPMIFGLYNTRKTKMK
jgi:hypothetical protein